MFATLLYSRNQNLYVEVSMERTRNNWFGIVLKKYTQGNRHGYTGTQFIWICWNYTRNSIEWNVRLSVGLALRIVKASEFELSARLTHSCLGPNWLPFRLSRWLLTIMVGLTSHWVLSRNRFKYVGFGAYIKILALNKHCERYHWGWLTPSPWFPTINPDITSSI